MRYRAQARTRHPDPGPRPPLRGRARARDPEDGPAPTGREPFRLARRNTLAPVWR